MPTLQIPNLHHTLNDRGQQQDSQTGLRGLSTKDVTAGPLVIRESLHHDMDSGYHVTCTADERTREGVPGVVPALQFPGTVL